ncbi:MAG: RES family NAD+ phosphorylase [Hyphomicrobiales bacterium]|nr:RES family NAD+ phosphorylase [Hyphomicrobiales bacterium]
MPRRCRYRKDRALLEELLEDTKLHLPLEARELHYLMAAPFRYGAVYPRGSRFRRAGRTPGVFYDAERSRTAAVQMAFHRVLFFAESPKTPWPANPGEFTAFDVPVRTSAALDLMSAPLDRDRAAWTQPCDYEPCQTLAQSAREAGIALIRYESVRNPAKGANLALLSPASFVGRSPKKAETWRIRLGPFGAQVIREFPRERIECRPDAFEQDPRLEAMIWDRG